MMAAVEWENEVVALSHKIAALPGLGRAEQPPPRPGDAVLAKVKAAADNHRRLRTVGSPS